MIWYRSGIFVKNQDEELLMFMGWKKYIWITALLGMLTVCGYVSARPISVSLYNNSQIQTVVISAYNTPLTVSQNNVDQYIIAGGQAVYAALYGQKIILSNEKGVIGSYDRLTIRGDDSLSVVRLKPVSPMSESRNFEDVICLYPDNGRLRLINRVEENRYISGVIEAETGAGRTEEFYKAKAVICRTYLYGHIQRHGSENFHLCDETHCQAYKGQCRHSDLIRSAVNATGDIILTDKENAKPILATYHSNCGGETESAKNAWQTNMPYLIPVTDPHCTELPNARWQKTISLDDWIAYLIKNGFNPDPNVVTDFSFQQVHRVPDYSVNNFSLPVKQIRNDWQLRSTFFNVSLLDGQVVLDGRGYGHGVGLCQEGAMEMGKKGYKYDEIISFYYKYVNLVPVSTIQIEIPDFSMR
ncbi:MAG: SpoIID/LytB domain-containing protein [Bacteroidales bacterium]|nr:SpoIID/LytB domain-containing protein [Bacteroidales bacterium]